VTYVLWAHGNLDGEYIFVTFEKSGNYNIGNTNGMNHLSLVKYTDSEPRTGIIGYSGGSYVSQIVSKFVSQIVQRPVFRIVIDPSGYVYEAVPSNRLTGVKTTVFYQENSHSVFWNANEYEQENPLYTDDDGRYAWDVPPGLWQVKYELDGYETAYSTDVFGWLPVPPPQLEVDVGMVSRAAPVVENAYGYAEGIIVEFSKYMKPASLTADSIIVTQNGNPVSGTVNFVDLEDNYDGTDAYASIIRFVPDVPLTETTVNLSINSTITSYADVPMISAYDIDLPILLEPTSFSAVDVDIEYGAPGLLIANIVPIEAAIGKSVNAISSNSNIVSVLGSAIVDDYGQVAIPLTGSLPGTAQVTLFLQDSLLQTTAAVFVGMPEPGQSQESESGPDLSGDCGDDLIWTLCVESGELIISGTGTMLNWSNGADNPPWDYYREYIVNVYIMSDTLTFVGENAFVDLPTNTKIYVMTEEIKTLISGKGVQDEDIIISSTPLTVSGLVDSYNLNNVTTLKLFNNTHEYPVTIAATTGIGLQRQTFNFTDVEPGTYTLEITKTGHIKFTVMGIVVRYENVDLTSDRRLTARDPSGAILLLCGDINNDGVINQDDLNLLWLPANYNKSVSSGVDERCDLNGDGVVNQDDLNILWLPVNYNKGAVTVAAL